MLPNNKTPEEILVEIDFINLSKNKDPESHMILANAPPRITDCLNKELSPEEEYMRLYFPESYERGDDWNTFEKIIKVCAKIVPNRPNFDAVTNVH